MRLLVIYISFILLSATRGYKITPLVKELSAAIPARLQVIYCFKMVEAVEELLRANETTKLLIAGPPYERLRNNFDQDLLAIVVLREQLLTHQREAAILQTLYRLRKVDMLFVTNANVARLPDWRWLFEWCWRHGFRNVQLLDGNGVLISYIPMPVVRPIITTLGAYLKRRRNWHKGSLTGYTLRVAANKNPPRAILYPTNSGYYMYTGEKPKILKLFADYYNATFRFVITRHFNRVTVEDCLTALAARQVDLCGDASITSDDFSIVYPYGIIYGYLLVPTTGPIKTYRYFLAPFQRTVWTGLVVFTACITLILSLIHWLHKRQVKVGHFFLITLSSLLYLPFCLQNFHGFRRFYFYMLLFVFGFIISNYYLAFLSSILSTNLYEREVRDIVDMRKRNISILTSNVTEIVFKLTNSTLQYYELKTKVASNILCKNLEDLNPAYAYFVTSDRLHFYINQQYFLLRPRMRVLPEPVAAMYGSIPTANDWAFKDLLDDFHIRIFEYGFIHRIRNDVMYEAVRLKQLTFLSTEYYAVVPLSMEYFEMPAILLTAGYFVALLVFLLECLLHWAHMKINRYDI